ncbi:MAG TPA: hypothetical protein VEX39_02280 [Thermoleophilaceae bacterium]|nr:hypothetical protein [Thermoleophilaceae bacterium]
MIEPHRAWWARPRKLLAMERPGGGGRSHRPERREGEIAWLAARRVRTVISTMATRHNLPAYEAAGLQWHHVPVPVTADGAAALEEILGLLRAELRASGAVAVHGNRHTDFVAAVCAAHLHEHRGVEPAEGLVAAAAAGLMVTPESCRLVGVDYEAVTPTSSASVSAVATG